MSTDQREFELLASGYSVVEGPVLDGDGNLYFTNVHEGGIHRLDPSGEIVEIVPRRRGVGGMCLHADGGLIVSGRNVSHIGPSGSRVLLQREDLATLGGAPVGGFNDLCADAQGRVLVGPTRRRVEGSGTALMAAGEHVPSELVLITAEGQHSVVYDGVQGVSNGVVVSTDNTTIYHAESGGRRIRVSRFVADDQVEHVDFWSTADLDGMPDGVALDVDGFLWVAMHGGGCLARFAPNGELDGTLPVPARGVTNLCFAGDQLLVTTLDNDSSPQLRGSIFRTPAPAVGAAVPVARI